ncbi:MAG: hypothetical protein E4H47_00740, partial [Parcubacteria group bacterium]
MKNPLTPINVINETSFHRAWQRAAAFIDEKGIDRVIGGPKEDDPEIIEKKSIRDSRQLIILTGDAITQMKKREMHLMFPFGPKQLDEYCLQFDWPYLVYWQKLPVGDGHRFKYIYFDRLVFPFDQLKAMKINLAEQIKVQISSNRTQATTWQRQRDAFNDEPPCLQRIQIMYLGEGMVDVAWDWRSRDINAWQSNKNCLTAMIYREVLTPNNCEI